MSTEICRHIRLNGARCKAFSLKGQSRCFYHLKSTERYGTLKPVPGPTVIAHAVSLDGRELTPLEIDYYTPPQPFKLQFPPLEDRQSIQLALSMLILAMAESRIDNKHAAPLLYGLQVASSNAKGLEKEREPDNYSLVRETVLDDAGEMLAPDEDQPVHPLTKALLERFEREDAEDALSDEEPDMLSDYF